ncbi:hypothetical protein NP233_g1197 [Leucocoprinus birnbaumii]|uniref:NAD(+) diphosphatase n=1 Tax=Leucocoprinus birnbaumii TaxID=56174 RepID=A0AAD5YV23_9AGAR|nr:hypothetical protein NP233_g1197 [Leucocoprinus birnbaumii]
MNDSSETFVNMFGGSPLNRLSWLRTSHYFLNAVVTLPQTKWLLFNAGQPLVVSNPSTPQTRPQPAYLSTSEVKPLLGPQPYFGQGEKLGILVSDEINNVRHSPTEAARHHPQSRPIVFLGVQEKLANGDVLAALPTAEFSSPDFAVEAIKKLDGIPYFAMEVADVIQDGQISEEGMLELFKESSQDTEGKVFAWSEPRALLSVLDHFAGAVFASAKSLVDWNYRNKFCPGCGSGTYSMWGGWKISCLTLLPWSDNTGKRPCPSGMGLHNYTHPRTDAVVIMIAIDETGNKVLLGRNRKFPGKFYSALAGFIEPGESFEDAVAREMWEEAGVRVWSARYHSGQPWPYPANLMVGFYARADSTKPIRTDLDNELVDARWFTREEILAVLNHRSGTYLSGRDYKKIGDSLDKKDDPNVKALAPGAKVEDTKPQADDPPFKIPPITAIAGVLIRDWAEGKIGFGAGQTVGPSL